jgi:homoserine O-acetyltransferase
MTNAALARRPAAQVEAYCSSGTSPGFSSAKSTVLARGTSSDLARNTSPYLSSATPPGFSGRSRQRIELDHHGPHVIEVSYEVHGPANAPAFVVLGGISAGRHLAPTAEDTSPGWWPGVVEPGGALDTTCQRLIGVDFLAGPNSTFRPTAPVTTHDQARAVAAVLDKLGAHSVTLVGASYGGMVALAFAELFADRVSGLVLVCAAHRTHPMATAWRSIQRSVVQLGEQSGAPEEGLALARQLAMTTYRSADEFEQRFDHGPSSEGAVRFPVQDYLEARGSAFTGVFDAASFLSLSTSIDLHRVDPRLVGCRTTLVSFDTDALVPPWLVEELAQGVPGVCEHVRVSSSFGHDAFLKEPERVSSALRTATEIQEVI